MVKYTKRKLIIFSLFGDTSGLPRNLGKCKFINDETRLLTKISGSCKSYSWIHFPLWLSQNVLFWFYLKEIIYQTSRRTHFFGIQIRISPQWLICPPLKAESLWNYNLIHKSYGNQLLKEWVLWKLRDIELGRPTRARMEIHRVEKHVLVLNQVHFPNVSSSSRASVT